MAKKSFKDIKVKTGVDEFLTDAPEAEMKELKINAEYQKLIEPLSPEEYSRLEQNLLENGIREPISVWVDTIIDGHNRYELAQKHNLAYTTITYEFENEDEVKLWILKNQAGRRNLSPYDRAKLALRMKPIIAAKAKEQQARKSADFVLQNSVEQNPSATTQQELAAIAGVSHDTIYKVEFLEQKAAQEIKDKIRRKELSIDAAYKEIKRRDIKAITERPTIYKPAPIDGKFDVLLVNSCGSTMELEAIKNIDVPAADDSIMFIWATPLKLSDALAILEAWQFLYKTCMVWHNGNKYELLLVGVKGNVKAPVDELSFLHAEDKTGKSTKPDYYYNLIENIFPGMRYLEIFAKKKFNTKWNTFNFKITSESEEKL